MLDRREFLVKSAATSAALAGAGVLHVPAALGAAKPTGWAVGDKAPKISGLDQYEGKGSLSHLHKRWVLLDVCATWCGPCNLGAGHFARLTAEANSLGIPFSLFTVLREGASNGSPSNRGQAEAWAHRYGFERESVLQCGGSGTSPLFKLIEDISAANGVESAFPCHLLIDPSGVVRYFQQGFDTEKLKTELANLTGVSLPGKYPLESPPNQPNIQSVTYSFGIQGKGVVSGTLAVNQSNADCALSVVEHPLGFQPSQAFLALPGGLAVDLSVPVSVIAHCHPLTGYVEGGVAEGSLPLALFAGLPAEFTNQIAGGGVANLINEADGLGSGIGPTNPEQMEHGPAWGTPANVIELEMTFNIPPAPYSRSLSINQQLVEKNENKSAQKLLKKGQKDMAHRDFATASTVFAEATAILGYGADLPRYVAWLASH